MGIPMNSCKNVSKAAGGCKNLRRRYHNISGNRNILTIIGFRGWVRLRRTTPSFGGKAKPRQPPCRPSNQSRGEIGSVPHATHTHAHTHTRTYTHNPCMDRSTLYPPPSSGKPSVSRAALARVPAASSVPHSGGGCRATPGAGGALGRSSTSGGVKRFCS